MKLEHEALELTDRKLQAADGKLESKDRMLENAIADEKVARQAKDAVLQDQVRMLESLLHTALDRIDTLENKQTSSYDELKAADERARKERVRIEQESDDADAAIISDLESLENAHDKTKGEHKKTREDLLRQHQED